MNWLKQIHKAITPEDLKQLNETRKPGRPSKSSTESNLKVASTEIIYSTRSQLAKLAIDKLRSHLSFMEEENIGFAFFDERISEAERSQMVQNLQIDKHNFKIENNTLVLEYSEIPDLQCVP